MKSISPVIVRIYFDNDCHATSGVLIRTERKNVVISPALPTLANVVKNESDLRAITRCIDKGQPFAFYDDNSTLYRGLRCALVPPGLDKAEVPLNLKVIFNSPAIRSTFDRLLGGGHSIKLSKDDSLAKEERTLLLSSFFAFELKENVRMEKSFKESHSPPPQGDFTVIATPYGNAIMQGSAFRCRVANVINGFLYLLDIPLSKNCEGGLLLTPNYDPLGMILTTTFESQNENINLTFAVDLNVIVQELGRRKREANEVEQLSLQHLPWSIDSASKFVVLIESGPISYGTGTLIKVGRKRLILTCSHVITHPEENFCNWNGRRFPIRLIYKNPVYDGPFDVAVFEAPKDIPNLCQSANNNPIVGSAIKSVGFPIFDPAVLRDLNIQPSVYRGKLVNYRTGMVITDTMIQSGQSGGPLFDDKDRLVAISVSNFRENDTGRVFPTLNCSVPMFNIISYLTEYSETNDPSALKRLEGGAYLRRLWNFEEPVVYSKM